MLSQQEARNLIDKAIGYSKLPGCQIDLYSSEDVFIRFANNGITTSGYRVTQNLSISSVTDDKRHGNAVVNELTDEALKHGVEQAEALARISKADPEDMPALGPQKYPALSNFDSFTGSARGDVMIPHVKAVLDSARQSQLTAAGFIQRQAEALARMSKADPEAMPALGPQKYPALSNFDSFTGSARGDVMIPHESK